MRVARLKVLLLCAAVGLVWVSSPLRAETPSCWLTETPAEGSGGARLLVACGSAAASLGRVDDYRIVNLPAHEASVVLTITDGSRRIWLAMAGAADSLVLEEITATVAHAVGRGVRLDNDGVDLDFSAVVAGKLRILLTPRARGEGKPGAVEVDLGALVARARSVRASVQAGEER